jgi:hypothetical protein
MSKRSGATAQELAILAGSCGLVANTEDGRRAFSAWLAQDQKAARKALFTRVAARRAAASASAAKASEAKAYPQTWAAKARSRAASVRGSGLKPVRSRTAPAAARPASRITEGND